MYVFPAFLGLQGVDDDRGDDSDCGCGCGGHGDCGGLAGLGQGDESVSTGYICYYDDGTQSTVGAGMTCDPDNGNGGNLIEADLVITPAVGPPVTTSVPASTASTQPVPGQSTLTQIESIFSTVAPSLPAILKTITAPTVVTNPSGMTVNGVYYPPGTPVPTSALPSLTSNSTMLIAAGLAVVAFMAMRR